MKKIFTFIATILLFVGVANAQERSVILSESFDGTSMPNGWSVMGVGTGNWSIKSSNYAGGEPNELFLNWNPQFNGTTRFVSPAIDLSGVSSFVFTFKMNIDFYYGSITVGIATSSDGGENWKNGWSKVYNGNTLTTVFEEISTDDVGSSDVLVCIFVKGQSYNFNGMYFDDIEAFTMENLDAKLKSINIDDIVDLGENEIEFTVVNYGLETINNLDADLFINDEFIVNEEFNNLGLESLDDTELSFNFKPELNDKGNFDIKVVINNVNGVEDDEPSNNSFTKTISTTLLDIERTAMIEVFTSSTCPPCASYNPILDNLLANNEGKYSIVKYQMNWPGSGDPYFNPDGNTRRNYYGIGGVPATVLDGTQLSGYLNQNILNNALNETACLDIIGNYTIDGNNINVDLDVVSFANVSDLCLLVSVNEKKTTGNVGTNGEKEFHHVNMKMLPSATGTNINLEAGQPIHFTFTQDMSNTHVEEMDDLEVAVFVQNISSKYIFNSKFLENVDQLLLPVQNLECTSADNETAILTWEKPDGVNPIGYNIYDGDDLVLSNVSDLTAEIEIDDEINVYSVEAVYENDLTSVKYSILYKTEEIEDELLPVQNLKSTEEYIIKWDAPASGTALSYNIYVNNELIDNTTELYYEFEGIAKSAEVCVTALYQNGESPKECITVDWLNIADLNGNVSLYPNPSSSIVNIDGVSVYKVFIYNNLGQLVKELSNTNQIDVSSFNTGVYFLNIIDVNNNNYNQKIVVK